MEIRIQKILANAGVASRRKAEKIITAGRVCVNGAVAKLGEKAADTDEITVDGVPLNRVSQEKLYIMLHKPEGVVTTVSDQFGRATVMDYVPAYTRVFPVGRLDYDTSGLLLLTNDGDWANNLTHPKHEIKKTYLAKVRGKPTEAKLQTVRTGIEIDGRLTAPAKIAIIKKRDKLNTTVQITIHEGRNRQVRKMCEAIGNPVITLQRIAIGKVKLRNLPVGKWRHLTESELTMF